MIATSNNIKPINPADKILESFLKGDSEESSGDECFECDTPLRIEVEQREGGYNETIAYCEGCGVTGKEE